jgi:arsenite-transporting ATPase
MSSVYGLWVNKMIESRKEAQSMRLQLSYTKKQEKDPLMDYLVDFKERMSHAKILLTDVDKTAFFFVTLPEALPIAVIRRFIDWFKEFGIPIGGVIVNMKIDDHAVSKQAPDFVVNRIKMQNQHMKVVEETFGGLVRAVIPLYETEVRGVHMLARVAEATFARAEPAK